MRKEFMSIERRLKRDIFSYLLLSNEYFEDLGVYKPTNEFYEIVEKLLDSSWKIDKESIWFVARNPVHKNKLPLQGWKIHISGTILNGKEILETLTPLFIAEKVVFKFVCDGKILQYINSKNYNRSGAGKFIAIYPYSEGHFKDLIEKIYLLTKKFSGPYILSDKPYKDSECVFYRYGGYQLKYLINIFGEKIPQMLSNTGDLIPDERLPYFVLPKWVKDPFENESKK